MVHEFVRRICASDSITPSDLFDKIVSMVTGIMDKPEMEDGMAHLDDL